MNCRGEHANTFRNLNGIDLIHDIILSDQTAKEVPSSKRPKQTGMSPDLEREKRDGMGEGGRLRYPSRKRGRRRGAAAHHGGGRCPTRSGTPLLHPLLRFAAPATRETSWLLDFSLGIAVEDSTVENWRWPECRANKACMVGLGSETFRIQELFQIDASQCERQILPA